jgi:hypothetical protein
VSDDEAAPLGWWAISGEAVLDMLRRAHAGGDPDVIYAEQYANSGHEHVAAGHTEAREPLRVFLDDALPAEPIDLGDDEMVTDAVVAFRVVRIDDGAERYRYTTTNGMTQGMCLGMLNICLDQISAVLASDALDDDGEDGDTA